MNNKIVWSEFAVSELRTIHYYYKINVTTQVAEKIKSSIFKAVTNLQKQALIGQIEENLISLKKEHRYIFESNYKIIYYYENSTIYITDIFDCRQNPQKMIR